jgi:S-adenosylmethionine synthetase
MNTRQKLPNVVSEKKPVLSAASVRHDELRAAVEEWARTQTYVSKCFVKGRNSNPTVHANPTGDWDQGGFDADTGLTGRKLVVDNYGPRIPIGGGCFSGKDPSKVDRSAAYMARKIALDYLERFQAHEVSVQLAYSIGVAEPLEATAIVDGTEKRVEGYDLTPAGIIVALDLRRPIYEQTARYGHFGRAEFPWEQ